MSRDWADYCKLRTTYTGEAEASAKTNRKKKHIVLCVISVINISVDPREIDPK